MSAAVVSDAILNFTSTHSYPEDEAIITTELTPTILGTVLKDLRRQRDDLKQDIRALSKTNGPNVVSWIDQAKKLQQDIQTSREIARQIVEEHAQGAKLKAQAADAENKIGLLERETRFEASLESTLLQVKEVHGLLLDTQDAIVKGQLDKAHYELDSISTFMTRFGHLKDTRCVGVLVSRSQYLQNSLAEAITNAWLATFRVNVKQHELIISEATGLGMSALTIVRLAEDTSLLPDLALKLSRDIERALLKPLFIKRAPENSYEAERDGSKLRLAPKTASSSPMFADTRIVLDFLLQHLPQPVLQIIIGTLSTRLLAQIEECWLEPLVPVDIAQLHGFERIITDVTKFVHYLAENKLGDVTPLKDWLSSLSRTWLTKQREALLGTVRNLVFQRLHETKIVERVETQMIGKDEPMSAQIKDSAEDDWDNGWDDDNDNANTEATTSTTVAAVAAPTEEDDGSAWDVDASEDASEDASAWDDDDGDGGEAKADGDEAWGWGDEAADTTQKSSPTKHVSELDSARPITKPSEREITFRETYTVTAIPDGILEAIQGVISDAQELAKDDYAGSIWASAAVGLYSLPTLALAIYRATAPTAYSKLPTGNMLIYNDAARLSERLREWQASQPPASRLRLDNDAKALDLFAKRAYSSEMELQKTILRDLLEGAQGFSNCVTPPFKQACEGAVEQTADRLHDVHREWKAVLGQNALLQSLGQLLSGVTGKMIADIEDLSDIGEADSRELKLLCERLSVVKALFAQQQPGGELRDMTFVYCPNWLKFQYLAEILESSLADIKFLWNEGELSLEFSSEEVVDLIKALFAESEHRRKLIGELRRQSRR